jgi:putative transposase
MRHIIPFAVGETYHLFNRGAHKQAIFTSPADYDRFSLLLYLANNTKAVNLRDTLKMYKGQTFESIFEKEPRDERLVDIYAYCLMPNHFHLVVQQKSERGITLFARKLLTGYSMYFNITHGHSGILSQGAIKSRHINNDPYFRYIFAYVHLNPLSLAYPGWEERGITDHTGARKFLYEYAYSSFPDYSVGPRSRKSVLSLGNTPDFLKTQNDLEELLAWYKAENEVGPFTKV